MEAARTYPTQILTQQITPSYTTPSTTICSGSASAYGNSMYANGNSNIDCTTTPSQHIPGVISTVDINADNRSQAEIACMYARGWQLVEVQQAQAQTQSPAGSIEEGGRCAFTGQCKGSLVCQDSICSRQSAQSPVRSPVDNLSIKEGGRCEFTGQCEGSLVCQDMICTKK